MRGELKNLLADFIKIIKTQQDNIIKYTYKTTLDKFSYGTDEVILNLVIYENKRNFNFFCLNNKILVIFLKSLCEINHFNMFKQIRNYIHYLIVKIFLKRV